MTFGSLFAGIGGIDLGLERAGMKCLWQVEKNPYALTILEKHWPHVPKITDIAEFPHEGCPRVDCLCGGFPCQPVSVAGKHRGKEDERWLWPEFHRVIREIKPRWVLVENVPGLLSEDAGRLFGGILRDLAQSGYDAEWDSLPAAAFGAPHIRYRVFLIAYAHGLGCQQPYTDGHKGKRPVVRGRDGQNKKKTRRRKKRVDGPGQIGEAGILANAHRKGLEIWESKKDLQKFAATVGASKWLAEPGICGVDDGVPNRVDRIKCLGNAVVPQIAEYIGNLIMKGEEHGICASA